MRLPDHKHLKNEIRFFNRLYFVCGGRANLQ